ncbi:MAG: hypothetical protein AAF799_04630 [Myxococcota bacterium]
MSSALTGDPPTTLVSRKAVRAAAARRDLLVGLSVSELIDLLAGRAGFEERRLDQDTPLMRVYFDGRFFYERHDDRVVLWRRPNRRGFRGHLEPTPYPDMLEVRFEPEPRGTRVSMVRRKHPLTSRATLFQFGMLAFFLVCMATIIGLGGSLWLMALGAAPLIQEPLRFLRTRRTGRKLMEEAYGVLLPHELGDNELQASAFRVTPALTSGPGDGSSE